MAHMIKRISGRKPSRSFAGVLRAAGMSALFASPVCAGDFKAYAPAYADPAVMVPVLLTIALAVAAIIVARCRRGDIRLRSLAPLAEKLGVEFRKDASHLETAEFLYLQPFRASGRKFTNLLHGGELGESVMFFDYSCGRISTIRMTAGLMYFPGCSMPSLQVFPKRGLGRIFSGFKLPGSPQVPGEEVFREGYEIEARDMLHAGEVLSAEVRRHFAQLPVEVVFYSDGEWAVVYVQEPPGNGRSCFSPRLVSFSEYPDFISWVQRLRVLLEHSASSASPSSSGAGSGFRGR